MACTDKRSEKIVDKEDKKRETAMEKFAPEALDEFYAKIDEMEPWEKKRGELQKRVSSLECSLRTTVGDSRVSTSDPLIEKFISNYVDKVLRTIDDLCNQLASVNEKNGIFQNRNMTLEFEMDQLRAMIRISSGNSAEYRERVDELNNTIVRIDEETEMLKRIREDAESAENYTIYRERLKSIEILMKELMMKLENDREAMEADGKSQWSEYTKTITGLLSCSESLLQQLERTKSDLRAVSCGLEGFRTMEYPKVIEEIEKLVKSVGSDLKSLKSAPMKIGTRLGGESCVQYLKRIRTLEKFVAASLSIIDKLIIDATEVSREKNKDEEYAERVRDFSSSRDSVVALVAIAKKLTSGIRELEISVASGDSANLTRRIRELERSLRRLKSEIADRDERNNSLDLELTGAKIAYDEKTEELEKLQKKYVRATSRMKKRGIDLEREDKKMENLLREFERSKLEAGDAKNLRDELNEIRPEIANFRSANATLAEEINRMRALIEEKNERIANITEQKENIERASAKRENETRTNLAVAAEEIKSLKRENSKLGNDLRIQSERAAASAEQSTKESQKLKKLLQETSDNLEKTRVKLTVLNNEFVELTDNKTEIDVEILRIKTQNENLLFHLNSEKENNSETLKNYDKLMVEFKSLKIECTRHRKNLEDLKRERDATKSAIEVLSRENVVLRDKSESLTIQLKNLTREIEESKAINLKIVEETGNLNEEKTSLSARLDSLTKDNEDLNDKLDSARSDKLDIAGVLNDWRLKYDESNNRCNDLQESLRIARRNFEDAKTSEQSASLEVARLLVEIASLRETIRVSNTTRTSLEEKLESLDAKYRELKNQLSVSENENKRLKEDSTQLEVKVDKLLDDLNGFSLSSVSLSSRSAIADENCTRDNPLVVPEREEKSNTMLNKLEAIEALHEKSKIELTRTRDENVSLKIEYERMRVECEKMRPRGGEKKSSESNQFMSENETTRIEVAKLRIATAEADRVQLGLAKSEREKLCAEIFTLRKENCTTKMLLDSVSGTNAKLEEQRNSLKIVNDSLRRNLEDARNEMTTEGKNSAESRATIGALKNTLEELKQRYGIAIRDVEEFRLQNEKLDSEYGDTKKSLESAKSENRALRREIDILRSALERVNDDNSKRRMDYAETEEELVALKSELSRARAENVVLRTELDTKCSESLRIESEKATLKEELEELKRTRILADEKGNELRGEYEKLKVLKVTLESKLMDALKEIGKYAIATAKLNGLENKLKGVLKDYVVTKKLLRTANDEVNHLRRLAEPCIRSLEVR